MRSRKKEIFQLLQLLWDIRGWVGGVWRHVMYLRIFSTRLLLYVLYWVCFACSSCILWFPDQDNVNGMYCIINLVSATYNFLFSFLSESVLGSNSPILSIFLPRHLNFVLFFLYYANSLVNPILYAILYDGSVNVFVLQMTIGEGFFPRSLKSSSGSRDVELPIITFSEYPTPVRSYSRHCATLAEKR